MRAFHNTGWPCYDKCLSIMFSLAARGSHVFCLTATTTTAPDEAEDDSTTAIDPPASSFLPAASSFLFTTAMDVNAVTNYPPPHAGTKHPHSPVISKYTEHVKQRTVMNLWFHSVGTRGANICRTLPVWVLFLV
jgi:hypothetical protein